MTQDLDSKEKSQDNDKESAAASAQADKDEAGPKEHEKKFKEKDFVIGHLSKVYLANNKTAAWQGLTDEEKNYAYYLSEAGHAGAKMIYHQISYESPPLFLLLSAYFQEKNIDHLSKAAVKKKIPIKTFLNFVLYSAGVFENYSNYNSFGSKKFVPELEPE